MAKPEVILFDVGNTLLFPNWQRILLPLTDRGILAPRPLLQATERRTKKEFDELVIGGRIDRGFWRMFYTRLLESLGLADEALGASLTASTQISGNWDQIRPGTREVLDSIGKKYRIGVISNADGKIANVLELCGICDCFLSITDSGLVGYEKPHPAIFQAALQAMNAAPEKTMYVGDVRAVDFEGATRAGMQALLFDACGAYQGNGLPRVESLVELEQRLENQH